MATHGGVWAATGPMAPRVGFTFVGRDLQEMKGQRPQQILTVPLLPGTDGVQKMSKSLGNYIGVDEPPNDIYGKTMSLPDSMILPYTTNLTDVPDGEE